MPGEPTTAVTVFVPTGMRSLCGGARRVEVCGATVRAVAGGPGAGVPGLLGLAGPRRSAAPRALCGGQQRDAAARAARARPGRRRATHPARDERWGADEAPADACVSARSIGFASTIVATLVAALALAGCSATVDERCPNGLRTLSASRLLKRSSRPLFLSPRSAGREASANRGTFSAPCWAYGAARRPRRWPRVPSGAPAHILPVNNLS